MDMEGVRVVHNSLLWIHTMVANFIFMNMHRIDFAVTTIKNTWEMGREAFALIETSDGVLMMLMRQCRLGLQNENLGRYKIQCLGDAYKHETRDFMAAVVNYIGWTTPTNINCNSCPFYHENSINPWNLVVLMYCLNRMIVCLLVWMRSTLSFEKAHQRTEFFRFLFNYHQNRYLSGDVGNEQVPLSN